METGPSIVGAAAASPSAGEEASDDAINIEQHSEPILESSSLVEPQLTVPYDVVVPLHEKLEQLQQEHQDEVRQLHRKVAEKLESKKINQSLVAARQERDQANENFRQEYGKRKELQQQLHLANRQVAELKASLDAARQENDARASITQMMPAQRLQPKIDNLTGVVRTTSPPSVGDNNSNSSSVDDDDDDDDDGEDDEDLEWDVTQTTKMAWSSSILRPAACSISGTRPRRAFGTGGARQTNHHHVLKSNVTSATASVGDDAGGDAAAAAAGSCVLQEPPVTFRFSSSSLLFSTSSSSSTAAATKTTRSLEDNFGLVDSEATSFSLKPRRRASSNNINISTNDSSSMFFSETRPQESLPLNHDAIVPPPLVQSRKFQPLMRRAHTMPTTTSSSTLPSTSTSFLEPPPKPKCLGGSSPYAFDMTGSSARSLLQRQLLGLEEEDDDENCGPNRYRRHEEELLMEENNIYDRSTTSINGSICDSNSSIDLFSSMGRRKIACRASIQCFSPSVVDWEDNTSPKISTKQQQQQSKTWIPPPRVFADYTDLDADGLSSGGLSSSMNSSSSLSVRRGTNSPSRSRNFSSHSSSTHDVRPSKMSIEADNLASGLQSLTVNDKNTQTLRESDASMPFSVASDPIGAMHHHHDGSCSSRPSFDHSVLAGCDMMHHMVGGGGPDSPRHGIRLPKMSMESTVSSAATFRGGRGSSMATYQTAVAPTNTTHDSEILQIEQEEGWGSRPVAGKDWGNCCTCDDATVQELETRLEESCRLAGNYEPVRRLPFMPLPCVEFERPLEGRGSLTSMEEVNEEPEALMYDSDQQEKLALRQRISLAKHRRMSLWTSAAPNEGRPALLSDDDDDDMSLSESESHSENICPDSIHHTGVLASSGIESAHGRFDNLNNSSNSDHCNYNNGDQSTLSNPTTNHNASARLAPGVGAAAESTTSVSPIQRRRTRSKPVFAAAAAVSRLVKKGSKPKKDMKLSTKSTFFGPILQQEPSLSMEIEHLGHDIFFRLIATYKTNALVSSRTVEEKVFENEDVDRLEPLLLDIIKEALTKTKSSNFPNPRVDEIVLVYQPANSRVYNAGKVQRERELGEDEDPDIVEQYIFWLLLDKVLPDEKQKAAMEYFPHTQICQIDKSNSKKFVEGLESKVSIEGEAGTGFLADARLLYRILFNNTNSSRLMLRCSVTNSV